MNMILFEASDYKKRRPEPAWEIHCEIVRDGEVSRRFIIGLKPSLLFSPERAAPRTGEGKQVVFISRSLTEYDPDMKYWSFPGEMGRK